MIRQKNVMDLIISNASTNQDLIVNTALTAGDLTEGQVAVVNPEGNVLDTSRQDAAGTTWTQVRVAAVENGNLRLSDIIEYNNIVSKRSNVYSAAVQQVDYVGYIGSGSGNIQAISANDYIIDIELMDTNPGKQFGNKRVLKRGVHRSVSASAVSSDICIALTDSLVDNFAREKAQGAEWIQFDAINSSTVTVGNCFDNDATVINGSEQFTVATNLQYGGVALAVGDYIRLGTATGAVGATALGSNTYEVISISSLTVTVDRPIESTSGTYTAAGNMAEVIPAATGDAANWGIRFTGIPFTYTPGQYNYKVPRWNITLRDFGTTTVTNSVAPDDGVGTYANIAEIEWFVQHNFKDGHRLGVPPPTSRADVDSATTGYDLINLQWYDQSTEATIGFDARSYKELIIASNEANDDDTLNNIYYALRTTFSIT